MCVIILYDNVNDNDNEIQQDGKSVALSIYTR